MRQYLSGNTVEITGRFAADSSGAAPFAATVPLDRTRFEGELGFGLMNKRGITINAGWQFDRSNNRDANVGTLRVSVPF